MTTVSGASFRALIRVANAAGGALQRAGVSFARFDAEALLRRARAQTGLDDFGGDDFREPLARLLHAYETEAGLTTIGRLAAWRDTMSLLANRLRLVEDRKRHPAIAAETRLLTSGVECADTTP